MTPKEKAKQLYDIFFRQLSHNYKMEMEAKCCAEACINEILQTEEYLTSYNDINGYSPFEFWEEVKKEIEKL